MKESSAHVEQMASLAPHQSTVPLLCCSGAPHFYRITAVLPRLPRPALHAYPALVSLAPSCTRRSSP